MSQHQISFRVLTQYVRKDLIKLLQIIREPNIVLKLRKFATTTVGRTFFPILAQEPPVGQDLIHKVSRPHTATH